MVLWYSAAAVEGCCCGAVLLLLGGAGETAAAETWCCRCNVLLWSLWSMADPLGSAKGPPTSGRRAGFGKRAPVRDEGMRGLGTG